MVSLLLAILLRLSIWALVDYTTFTPLAEKKKLYILSIEDIELFSKRLSYLASWLYLTQERGNIE